MAAGAFPANFRFHLGGCGAVLPGDIGLFLGFGLDFVFSLGLVFLLYSYYADIRVFLIL